MLKKYGFVYIWFDSAKTKSEDHIKRYYIGSHWGTEDDGYICSSTWMRNSYKRRSEDFQLNNKPHRRILSRIYTNRKDLLIEEEKWLSLIKWEELEKRYYNRSRITLYNHLDLGHPKLKHSEEHRNKISKNHKTKKDGFIHHQQGKSRTNEVKEKISKGLKNKEFSEEHKKHLFENHWTKKDQSQESKEKISKANKGKKHTKESIEKISNALKGRTAWNKGKSGIYTKEHKLKIGLAHRGKTVSEETKRKISETLRNKQRKYKCQE